MAIIIEPEDMEKLLDLGDKSIEEARAVWDELGEKYNFDPNYVASVSVDTMQVMIKRDEEGPHTEWKGGK